jgi:hypothetical protein
MYMCIEISYGVPYVCIVAKSQLKRIQRELSNTVLVWRNEGGMNNNRIIVRDNVETLSHLGFISKS